MIIWRVETEDHFGPFQYFGNFVALPSAYLPTGEKLWDFSEDTHPAYAKDFGGEYTTGVFGCMTLDDLKKWFGYKNTVEYLKTYSFQVVKYEAEENRVILGKSGIQCVFDLFSAKMLCNFSIKKLLDIRKTCDC